MPEFASVCTNVSHLDYHQRYTKVMYIGSSSLLFPRAQGSSWLGTNAVHGTRSLRTQNHVLFPPATSHVTPLSSYKEIYSSILSPNHHEYLPDEDPVSKIDLVHAHECVDHFGRCSMKEMEAIQNALHTERIQTSFLGNNNIVLNPMELVDHYQLEDKLSQQLHSRSMWQDTSQIPFRFLSTGPGTGSILSPTDPTKNLAQGPDFELTTNYVVNAVPGLLEMVALLLIWFIMH